MEDQQKIVINKWLSNVIKNGSWQSYDDLHIDKIDTLFKSKNQWINGGLNCLTITQKKLKEKKLNNDFDAALAFSLLSKTIPIGINFYNIDQMKKEFDHSPPSIYIFKKDWSVWEKQIAMSRPINISGIQDFKCLYFEYLPENGDGEYRRSVFLI